MPHDPLIFALTLLGIHVLTKFAFFFVLPYRLRRAALDRAYRNRQSATAVSDAVLLIIAVLLGGALLFREGGDAAGVLGGFWVGATLTQLFFHRFKATLPEDRAPAPGASPIKTMSYAIQDRPARAWLELLAMAVFVIACLVLVWRQ